MTPRKPPLVPERLIERYLPPPRAPRYRGEDSTDRATPEMDARDPHAHLRLDREDGVLVLRIESFESTPEALAGIESGDGFTVEREGQRARLLIEREDALARAAAHALARVMVILDRVRPNEHELLDVLRPHLEEGLHVNDVYWRGQSTTAYASLAPLRREAGGPTRSPLHCFEIWLEAGHWRVTPVYRVPRWWVSLFGHAAVTIAPRRCLGYFCLVVVFIAGIYAAGAVFDIARVTLPLCTLAIGMSAFSFSGAWKRGVLSPSGYVPLADRIERGEPA